jgi:6-phosphogluconolactonase (cycloisomerase 2 family)
VTLLPLALAGCGGGGGGGSSPAVPSLFYVAHRVEAAVGVPLEEFAPVLTPAQAGVTYSITPALPAGLTLDPVTGVLSGTPSVTTAAGEYQVTAGSVSTTFELRVSLPTRFLVSASDVDGTLLVQGLDGSRGAPQVVDLVPEVPGLPPVTDLLPVASPPLLLAAHGAAGQAGTLVVYDVNTTTGALTERGRVALGTGPHRVAVAPGGQAAYVTDQGDDVVRAFRLGVGAPTPIGAPLATGDAPDATVALATTAGTRALVVANRGGMSLSSYAIDTVTHGLTMASGNFQLNGGVPAALASVGDGESVVVVLDNFGLAVTARVESTAALASIFGGAQTGLAPSSAAVHPAGDLVLVTNEVDATVTVLSRAIEAGKPPLTPVQQISVPSEPTSVRFDAAGRFAYVVSTGSGEVTVLAVDPVGAPRIAFAGRARLRPGAGPIATFEGAAPFERRLANLYVPDSVDHTITVLAPSSTSDENLVAPVAPVITAAAPAGAVVSPDGATLFVTLPSLARVDAYPLGSNGAPGTPVENSVATLPVALAVAPGGGLVVVASQSPPLLTTYTHDGSGQLTAVDVEALPSPPGDVVVDPAGRSIAVTAVAAGRVLSFRLGADGTLGPASDTSIGEGVPRSLGITPDGRFLAVALENRDLVSLFSLGSDAALASVPPASVDGNLTGDRPVGIALHPTGTFALATVFAGGGSPGSGPGSVDVFGLAGDTGALSRVGSLTAGLGPVDAVFEPRGRVAYAVNATGQDLSILRFDPTTGALSSQGAVALGDAPLQVVERVRFP